MDSDSISSDNEIQDTSRLRESVSMVIRQLQPQARAQSDEIPESEEEDGQGDDSGDNDEGDRSDDGGDDYDAGNGNTNDYELQQSQHSISPTASHDATHPDDRSLHAEPDTQDDAATTPPLPPFPTLTPPRRQLPPAHSPFSTVPPTPSTLFPASPRKRSRSPSLRFPSPTLPRPPKRPRHDKPATFNPAYLSLLNEDIVDAAARFTPHAWTTTTADGDTAAPPLVASQIGMTHWSEAEKVLFFEAVGRLGRDDVAGIAGRVRTKGVVEVAAFLRLLEQEERKGVGLWEVPAAVEVSQACCAALEEAADAVAARQEAHEEAVERRRWGEERWVVGRGTLDDIEGLGEEGMAAAGLFRLRNWLGLAERVFMNASVEEYNWTSVGEYRPAVRATAMQDFYALAVSVTKRLVAATIYVAESRVRAKREVYPATSRSMWRQDVEAAALSLGLPTDSRRFWASCARRLRLDVYDEEEDDVSGEDETEPMSYDEVEKALGLGSEVTEQDARLEEEDEGEETSEEEEESDDDLASTAESDAASVELDAHVSKLEAIDGEPLGEEDEAEKESVNHEMKELLVHSALEYPKTKRARDVLRHRIRAARTHEAYAAALDARASYSEEKRLWTMLDRQPPVEPAKVELPDEPPRCTKRTVDDLIRGFSRTPGGDDWRSKLEVIPSTWEMEFALTEEKKGEQQQQQEQQQRDVVTESGEED